MGSRTYGTKTTSFSTSEEMLYAQAMKQIFPIKMLREGERFAVAATEFYFEAGVKWFAWRPGAPMPERLVGEILKVLGVAPAPAEERGRVEPIDDGPSAPPSDASSPQAEALAGSSNTVGQDDDAGVFDDEDLR